MLCPWQSPTAVFRSRRDPASNEHARSEVNRLHPAFQIQSHDERLALLLPLAIIPALLPRGNGEGDAEVVAK